MKRTTNPKSLGSDDTRIEQNQTFPPMQSQAPLESQQEEKLIQTEESSEKDQLPKLYLSNIILERLSFLEEEYNNLKDSLSLKEKQIGAPSQLQNDSFGMEIESAPLKPLFEIMKMSIAVKISLQSPHLTMDHPKHAEQDLRVILKLVA